MIRSAPGSAGPQSLAARFVEAPYVGVPDKAEQGLADWLAELDPGQSAAISELLDASSARTALLGIIAFSPYLFELIRVDAPRLIRLLRCEPESHLARLIETASREVFSAAGETEAMRLLRGMKAEAALLIALCDIGGVWPVMQVTSALTWLAVSSVQAALRFLLR